MKYSSRRPGNLGQRNHNESALFCETMRQELRSMRLVQWAFPFWPKMLCCRLSLFTPTRYMELRSFGLCLNDASHDRSSTRRNASFSFHLACGPPTVPGRSYWAAERWAVALKQWLPSAAGSSGRNAESTPTAQGGTELIWTREKSPLWNGDEVDMTRP